uniref:Secreted protein n=1 Tax=Heterorhabditis bacteriophora TaxID=37862 RepID=A0A1I7XBL6_HETBA
MSLAGLWVLLAQELVTFVTQHTLLELSISDKVKDRISKSIIIIMNNVKYNNRQSQRILCLVMMKNILL